MRLRYAFTLLLLAAVACRSRVAPEIASRDADAPPLSTVVSSPAATQARDTQPDAQPPMLWLGNGMRGRAMAYAPGGPLALKAQKREPFVGAPEDPRITACKAGNTDGTWESLKKCLDPLANGAFVAAPQTDAGHKLGAVRPPIQCPSQAISDWHFDASTGDNRNSCVDAGHPCDMTTGPQEVQGRWGCGASPATDPRIGQATVLHMHGNAPLSATAIFQMRPRIIDAGSFAITCDTTSLGSGSLAGLVARQRVGPGNQSWNVDLGANATTAVSVPSQICVASRGNSCAWAQSIVSGTTVLITQPLNPDDSENDAWQNGDAYTLPAPDRILPSLYDPDCGVQHTNTLVPINCADRVTLNNCSTPSQVTSALQYWSTTLGHVHVHNSRFDGQADLHAATLSNSGLAVFTHNFENSVMIGGYASGLFITGDGDQFGNYLSSDVILHGSNFLGEYAVVTYDEVALDPGQQLVVDGVMVPGVALAGSPLKYQIYKHTPNASPFTITTQFQGEFSYGCCGVAGSWTAANSFGTGGAVPSLNTSMGARALARDLTHQRVDWLGPIGLTIANLDLDVPSGGFGGTATDIAGGGGFLNWTVTNPTPQTPYVAQNADPGRAIAEDPFAMTGSAASYRADFNSQGSGRMHLLQDESGNGLILNTLTGSGAFGPIPATINGVQWMQFNGTDTTIFAGGTLPDAGTTTFVVMKSTAGTTGIPAVFYHVDFYDNLVGTHWGTYNSGACDSGVNVDDGLPHILAIRTRNFNDLDLITDNGIPVTCSAGAAFNARVIGLGGDNTNSPFTGFVGAAALVNSVMTDGQIDFVERALAGKWGVKLAPSSVATGGTGIPTCAAGYVLEGNGTSPMTCVAPGTAGNVLTSVSGAWASAAPAAAGITAVNGTNPINCTGSPTANCSLSTPVAVTFGGTGVATCASGTVPHGNGTGAMTCSGVALGTDTTGTLPATQGGTGVASPSAGGVLIANGASAMTTIAFGASGNLLTSNGTDWVSSAPFGTLSSTNTAAGTASVAAFGNPIVTAASMTFTPPSGSTALVLVNWTLRHSSSATASDDVRYGIGTSPSAFVSSEIASVSATNIGGTGSIGSLPAQMPYLVNGTGAAITIYSLAQVVGGSSPDMVAETTMAYLLFR